MAKAETMFTPQRAYGKGVAIINLEQVNAGWDSSKISINKTKIDDCDILLNFLYQ